jgi:hypothetical protein
MLRDEDGAGRRRRRWLYLKCNFNSAVDPNLQVYKTIASGTLKIELELGIPDILPRADGPGVVASCQWQ